jgi:hypothetical protein
VITTANSGEPPYADQIPVAYGGSATAPGGQPDIAGPASANFQIDPILLSGTDTNVETTPGRGTFGFQGVPNTIVVTEVDQKGWVFFDDNPGTGTGSGGFQIGPGTPPLGAGSAFLTVDSQGRFGLGTAAYVGTYLQDIPDLRYSSYQQNNANTTVAASFQFDVDYDLNDASNTYQGRLVFEPYQSGTVLQNVWQEWNVLAGKWYGTRSSVIVGGASVPNPCTQAAPCTTAQILAAYPNLGVRNAPFSLVLFKAGGPWAPGFLGNVDAFKLQVNGAAITYDFEPPSDTGTFQFSQATYTVGENQATATITVTRTGSTAGTATIHYATSDGTATQGADYVATSGDVTFASGETSKTFTVSILDDGAAEPDETVTLTLSNPTYGATIGSPNPATLTITNDDCFEAAPNMVAWYAGEGNTNDIQGPTFETGAWVGTPAYGTGKVGQAFDFNGTDSYVTAPGNGSLDLTGSQMTLDGWIYPRTNTSGTFYFAKSASSDHPYVVYFSGGTIRVIVSTTGADNQEFDTLYTPPTNAWTHLALVYSNPALTFYVNGTAVFSANLTPGNLRSSTLPFAIGNRATDPGAFFNGLIDEVEVFSAALTPTEVANIYNAGIAGKCKHGLIQFSAPTYTVGEGGTNASIVVKRTDGSVGAVSAQFDTSNGTATAGSDYTAVNSFIVNFADGDTADKTVTIPITDDNIYEGDETVNLALTNATGGAQIGPQGTAVLTITDNESVPTISINNVSVGEGGGTAVFTVTQSGLSVFETTFNYATNDGTAVAPGDYATASGSGSIPAGSTTTTISVPINEDNIYENDQTFTVTLSNPANATLGANPGTGTIQDNDTPPTLAISDVTLSEGNTGTTSFIFTVTRTGPTEAPASVNFQTHDGTATIADNDYQNGSGTLNFSATDSSKQITVLVNGDSAVEPDETFTVKLSGATGSTISDDEGVGTIVNDDTSISIGVSPSSVGEDGGQELTYTFTRSPQTTGSVTINFSVGGTATFGSDYGQTGATSFSTSSGTVVIPDGQTSATITILPTVDSAVEPDETVILKVTAGSAYTVGTPDEATGTITNDDTNVTVTVSPGSVTEDGTGTMVYTFTRNPVLAGPITIGFSVGGTAAYPADYAQTGAASFTATSGSVTFADGSNTATVTVDPADDNIYESNETVILTVGTGPGYSAGSPAAATGTITDNDTAPHPDHRRSNRFRRQLRRTDEFRLHGHEERRHGAAGDGQLRYGRWNDQRGHRRGLMRLRHGLRFSERDADFCARFEFTNHHHRRLHRHGRGTERDLLC